MLQNAATYIFAGLSAVIAIGLATWQIINHLQHYSQPVFQRYIVRIIFMVPVYSVSSYLSLIFPKNAIYFDTFRICYEAFVIYNFLALCLAFVGGPGAVELKMNGFLLMPSFWSCTCCLPPQLVDGLFVRRCKQGTLQFVLLMPILGILSTVLHATGHYSPGFWGPSDGYLYITIVYNITYSVALFALLMFYLGTHEMLAPFNPLLKFILVKSVVFFTFWQGILIAILVGTGALSTGEDGSNVQNLLICLEMLPASIAMFYAFPYSEYKDGGAASGLPSVGNAMHAISIHDVASDTVHQFAPTYRDYVLYSDSNSPEDVKEPPKTFRAKTFVAIGSNSGTANDGKSLLRNMEMGNAAQWYSQGGLESSPVSPAAQEMRSSDAIQDSALPLSKATKLKPAASKVVAKSDTPDLSYINDSCVNPEAAEREKSGSKVPQTPVLAPAAQMPSGAGQAQPSWADVGLD